MKKILAILLAVSMLFCFAACGQGGQSGNQGNQGPTNEEYNKMSMAELYELAKAEGGTVEVYATTADANTAIKKFKKDYPDINIEYISCDTNTVGQKIEMEGDTGNVNADVLLVKDNSGEVFHELVGYDYLTIYMPEAITAHIDPNLTKYGLPLYASFNPWFYNTRQYSDGAPIKSWWDIVEGYDEATGTFPAGAQKWYIYTKDITGPSYISLWAQIIADGEQMGKQYKEQYGKDLVITYNDKLNNTAGVMEFPKDNPGVELFYRFTQMQMTELDDGDGVVDAVDQAINGPTLGLTSASKIDNAANGKAIAWVTGLEPYTSFQACSNMYVVNNCDNPAGARLFIMYCLGGEDGQSGCYSVFDKAGAWSVRDDFQFTKTTLTAQEVNLKTPDFETIYQSYPNALAYWTYWRSLRK